MDKIRQLLWNMGMEPSRTTCILVGVSLISCLAIILFGILLALTHDSLFQVLIVLAAAPASILLLGSSKFAESWLVANRKERAGIEKEMMFDLLRRWVRTTSSAKDTRQP
jgi:hypothetical protein